MNGVNISRGTFLCCAAEQVCALLPHRRSHSPRGRSLRGRSFRGRSFRGLAKQKPCDQRRDGAGSGQTETIVPLAGRVFLYRAANGR